LALTWWVSGSGDDSKLAISNTDDERGVGANKSERGGKVQVEEDMFE
jgi:hypothetical protein